MDSGNSGSLQSSSGGGGAAVDEDYDSMSSFLNNHSSAHFNHNPILQPPPSSSSSHHLHPTLVDTTFFDPSSASYFAPSNSTNPNPVYDPVWSRNIPPDPSFTGFGATQNDDVYLNSQQPMYANQSPPVTSNANHPGGGSDHHHQVGVTTKNPKKRTRASRRAPTTVLTTDTTNFRQMVQEFTGIPTAPFSASSSSPYSRRLDLFGGGGIGPLYPVRPSPQKVQLQQPSVSSVDASSSNYQLPPSDIHGFQKQPQTLLNSQNPLFSFQSLLQTKLPQQVNAPILSTTKSDNQQSDLLTGFPSSSTRWRDQNENLVNFERGNHNKPKLDGFKLNTSDFDHQTKKGLENSDQTQGNVDSWLCPSD